jgi:hemerythrin-like domain-containing protein
MPGRRPAASTNPPTILLNMRDEPHYHARSEASMTLDDGPFAQLERSHRRLEERLDDLARTSADETVDVGVVRDVAAFLARAVRRHEQDEEESLFPRLASRSELAPMLDGLTREHRQHEALHARLAALVGRLEAGDAGARSELDAVADALVRAYRAHIDEEERHLFPAARAALGDGALEEMAEEMQLRRGRRESRGQRGRAR